MIIVDNKMIREPNLLTPGKKPVGNVEIDWDNPLLRRLTVSGCLTVMMYWLISFW